MGRRNIIALLTGVLSGKYLGRNLIFYSCDIVFFLCPEKEDLAVALLAGDLEADVLPPERPQQRLQVQQAARVHLSAGPKPVLPHL